MLENGKYINEHKSGLFNYISLWELQMFPACAAEEFTATESGQIIHEMEEI